MKKCPFCAEMIQEDAVKCRYCGEFLDGRPAGTFGAPVLFGRSYFGYEYKSKFTLFGWPLVHVASGIDPQTNRPRVARGIIAIGNIAVGLLALGGVALGGIALGGVGIGIGALGGLAIGGVAFGGGAFAAYLAVGGLAVSLKYAIGGLAIAPHALGGTGADPELLRKIKSIFGKY